MLTVKPLLRVQARSRHLAAAAGASGPANWGEALGLTSTRAQDRSPEASPTALQASLVAMFMLLRPCVSAVRCMCLGLAPGFASTQAPDRSPQTSPTAPHASLVLSSLCAQRLERYACHSHKLHFIVRYLQEPSGSRRARELCLRAQLLKLLERSCPQTHTAMHG